MYESESSTFEAKFKPPIAIVWIEKTLPYPGNATRRRSKKTSAPPTSPSTPWSVSASRRSRLLANLAKSSAAYRRYPAFSSPVFRVRPEVMIRAGLTAQEANAAHPFIERAPMEEHNAFDIPVRRSPTLLSWAI